VRLEKKSDWQVGRVEPGNCKLKLFWKKSTQPEALEFKPKPKSPKPEYIDAIAQLDRAAVKGAVFARCSPLLFSLAISGPLLNPNVQHRSC
jgi:hypothetical protein